MRKYAFYLLFIAFMPVVFSSCLKDANITDRNYGLDGIEDVKLIELSNAPYNLINLEYSTNDTTFSVLTVHANLAEPASEDIVITVALDSNVVKEYNADHGTNFKLPPANIYTMGNLSITIPKGSRDGHLKLTAKPSDISAGEYAMGFRILSVSNPAFVISENYKTVVARLSVKNRYDGVYYMRSKQLDWAAAFGISNMPWEWPSNYQIHMITSSANSVNMYSTAHAAYIHPTMTTAGGLSGFGTTNPRFVFDLATNKLINVVNDAAGSARTFLLNPAVTDSRYDPATKTIYAAFILRQPGRTDLQIFDTLTYRRAR